jgi:hypothetical protein
LKIKQEPHTVDNPNSPMVLAKLHGVLREAAAIGGPDLRDLRWVSVVYLRRAILPDTRFLASSSVARCQWEG